MTPVEIMDILGIDPSILPAHITDDAGKMHQLKRKVRLFCYAMQTPEDYGHVDVPTKFIKYFEGHNLFEGWGGFAKTWDVKEENPSNIYFRDFSVEQEWDATLRRVVPVLPVDRANRRIT